MPRSNLLSPKVFISVPNDIHLTPQPLAIKEKLWRLLTRAGFKPQYFNTAGLPLSRNLNWSFENVQSVIAASQGAVILGFARWQFQQVGGEVISLATEYNHFEGALALRQDIPILILAEQQVRSSGILWKGGKYVVEIPTGASVNWLDSKPFRKVYEAWRENVKRQRHIFLGYSSGAKATANAVKLFLNSMNVSVLDWVTDFPAGGTILEQIEEAARLCLCGIFLFTCDDQLVSTAADKAAPRDNVVFEAGYFTSAKGKEYTLIIREDGAKMPADVGGQIYLPLKDRNDISSIETDLRRFVEKRLGDR